jgi:hypothetical protein
MIFFQKKIAREYAGDEKEVFLSTILGDSKRCHETGV